MRQKKHLLILLLLPLILGGCFFNGKPNNNGQQSNSSIYHSSELNDFSFSVKYPEDWKLSENSTGKFGEFKDQVIFESKEEKITLAVLEQAEKENILENYNIELQTQTEVSAILSERYIGSLKDNNQRFETVLVPVGDYLLSVASDHSGSADFNYLLSNISIIMPKDENKSDKITLTLYFDNNQSEDFNCEALGYKKVTIDRPTNDLSLIPQVINLLIQLSQSEELVIQNLLSSIPINTRLYSFGYEDNRAIVNFSSELNQGGGSCLMEMRRSQIEKTLKALNEVSDLDIRDVEIQAEGASDTALQP